METRSAAESPPHFVKRVSCISEKKDLDQFDVRTGRLLVSSAIDSAMKMEKKPTVNQPQMTDTGPPYAKPRL